MHTIVITDNDLLLHAGPRFSLTSSSVYSEGTNMRINQLKEPGI